jgi:predicted transcriptional regulator
MKPLCEVIALEMLPAVRAMVARKLVVNYGLSQKQAAEKLGVSQPAISQYKRDLRGYKTGFFKENPKLLEDVNSLAKMIASGELNPNQATIAFCELCKAIRFDGTGCQLHKGLHPSLETCTICMENKEFYGCRKEKKKIKQEKKAKSEKKTGLKPLSKF